MRKFYTFSNWDSEYGSLMESVENRPYDFSTFGGFVREVDMILGFGPTLDRRRFKILFDEFAEDISYQNQNQLESDLKGCDWAEWYTVRNTFDNSSLRMRVFEHLPEECGGFAVRGADDLAYAIAVYWMGEGDAYPDEDDSARAIMEKVAGPCGATDEVLRRWVSRDPLFVTTKIFAEHASPELRRKHPEAGSDFGFFDTKKTNESAGAIPRFKEGDRVRFLPDYWDIIMGSGLDMYRSMRGTEGKEGTVAGFHPDPSMGESRRRDGYYIVVMDDPTLGYPIDGHHLNNWLLDIKEEILRIGGGRVPRIMWPVPDAVVPAGPRDASMMYPCRRRRRS